METEVINPVRSVRVAGREIEVRELAWPDGMDFLRRLAAQSGNLINESGAFVVSSETMVNLVTGSQELSEFLLEKSSGLTKEELATMRLPQVIELLTAALELNLSDELLGKGKRLAERVAVAFGGTSTQKVSAA